MKSIASFSIESDVLGIFKNKFRGQCSALIEAFMRDIIGMDRLVLDPQQSEEQQLNKMIEEASAEQHKASLQLRAAELRRKQLIESKQSEEKNRILEQRKIDQISQEEYSAIKYIRESDEALRFKLAQEMAAKEGKTITAKEFVETLQGRV
jgi:hypothetical protein